MAKANEVRVVNARANPEPVVVCGLERHAAHTNDPFRGWDLDRWTYAQPTRLPVPAEVPADAEYNHGFRDANGVQHWVYYRRAPLSPGRCPYCPPEVPAAEGRGGGR